MSRLQELKEVLLHSQQAWNRGEQTALVMVMSVKGSAYRRPGSKMMMASDQTMFGMISGGCLESDLYEWALMAMKDGKAMMKTHDLNENKIWSLGVGCNGVIDLLILPMNRDRDFWTHVLQTLQQEKTACLVIDVEQGVPFFLHQDGILSPEDTIMPVTVEMQAAQVVKHQTCAAVMEENGRRFVLDAIRPNEKLLIAGAGMDAVPVVKLAAQSDFTVTVLDPRPEYNNKKIPNAACLVKKSEDVMPGEFSDYWWVIMNHHQERDEIALHLAIHSQPKFVGVLGPIRRTEEIMEHIGEETPFEVAVSITSQLLAVKNRKEADALHGKEKIHV